MSRPCSSSTVALHRLAVLAAELENVTDLDAAHDLERARRRRARVAVDHVAEVRGRGLRQVAAPVDAGEVQVLLVRAADEVASAAAAWSAITGDLAVRPGRGSPARSRTRPRCAPASAMRSGLATAGDACCALTAFSSWSPRSSSATRPPSAPSTTSVLSEPRGGQLQQSWRRPRSCARPASRPRACGSLAAARGSRGGSATASSRLAA